MAAIGYATLGKPKAVALIKEALKMLSNDRNTLMRKGIADIGSLRRAQGDPRGLPPFRRKRHGNA
jgi:hypothetical protein